MAEEINGVHTKLLVVQSDLKAPKNQFNKIGNYHYRNCEDILEAVKPLLQSVGANLRLKDDVIQIGDRYYIKATAVFTDIETGETIENTALARESIQKKGMDESQITGAASSYARKYALNGLFCIDDVKDADHDRGEESSRGHRPPAGPQRVSDDMINTVSAELKRTNIAEGIILETYKIKRMRDMTIEQFKNFMGRMKKTPDYVPVEEEIPDPEG